MLFRSFSERCGRWGEVSSIADEDVSGTMAGVGPACGERATGGGAPKENLVAPERGMRFTAGRTMCVGAVTL